MQKWRQWETASKAEWGLALDRELVVRPLAEEPRLAKARVQQAMLLGLSRSVVYDLVRRFRLRPKAPSLLPWKRGRSHNLRLLDPAREDLMRAAEQTADKNLPAQTARLVPRAQAEATPGPRFHAANYGHSGVLRNLANGRGVREPLRIDLIEDRFQYLSDKAL